MIKSFALFLAVLAPSAFAQNFYFNQYTEAKKTTPYCSYKISLPRVLAAPDAAPEFTIAAAKLNQLWQSTAGLEKKEFEESANQPDACSSMDYAYQSELSLEFKNALDSKLVSIVYNKWVYSGGAHGNYVSFSGILDTTNGKIYSDLSVFIDQSALPGLLNTLEKALVEQNSDIDPTFGWNTWKAETIDVSMISQFYFTEEGITLFFNPYEIGSYAEGQIEIFLGWNDLKSNGLKTSGPAVLLPTSQN